MLLVLRKLFFYLLLILYVVITPSIILYALGYMIDPGEKGIYKTGLVSIMTEPKSALLYVGGKKFSRKTPTAIHDLLPGRYTVRLVQKGYAPWEKEIEIRPEKATRLEPVLLLPLRPETEVISGRHYEDFIPHIVDFKLYAWEGPTLDTLRRIDLIFKRETALGQRVPDAEKIKILKAFYKENSGLIVFETEKEGKHGYVVLEAGQGKFFDLSGRFEKNSRIEWDAKEPSRVYAVREGLLSSIELHSGKSYPLDLPGPLTGFGTKHSRLYFLKNDFSLVESSRSGETLKPLFEKNEPGPMIFQGARSSFYQIESFRRDIFQKDLFLFLGNRGELLSNWPPYRLVSEGVRGVQYATDGDEEKILYWTSSEIGVIYFQKESETVFEKGLSPETLYINGKDIRQAFWAFEDSHILFRDGERVLVLETKNEEPHLAREVAAVAPGSSILYENRGPSFYALEPSGRMLVKRKITD